MLLVLPIRTSIYPRRTPYANYILIALNIAIFFLEWQRDATSGDWGYKPWVYELMLTPARPAWWQFITYAFLHGGPLHLIGNMFFLYLFGNNINDKIGSFAYICFYLAGGVFSALGHIMVGGGDVLGASGAVAAVTGAYLVLFPQTLITVLYWVFFFIGTFEIPALYFIGFKLIFWDNVLERRMANVAHDAHLSGYAYGILAMLGLMAVGLVSTTGFDLWSMIKQWNRRRRYRDAVAAGYDPYAETGTAKRIKSKVRNKPEQKQKEDKILQLRHQIAKLINQRNLPAAADKYLELIGTDRDQVLARQYLLDIANQLAGEGKSPEAAYAYEQLLNHYGNYEYIEQVQLMLGLLYSRYLDKPDAARKYLKLATQRLTEPGQLEMCREELAKLDR